MIYGNIGTINKLTIARDEVFTILKGPKGLGKSVIGKSIAKYNLCLSKSENCECESCRRVGSGTHPDLIFISKAQDSNSIKVADIDRIFSEAISKPLISQFKVVLIDDANSLTQESQNKLLKTLEEPPAYMKFIFIAHGDMLSTVHSRAKVYNFYALSIDEMRVFINTLLDIKSEFHKEILIACSNGCPGIAHILRAGNFIKSFEEVIDLLINQSSREVILQSTGLLKEKDSQNIIDVLEDEMEYFLSGLRNFWLDVLKLKCSADKIIYESQRLILASKAINIAKVRGIIKTIDDCIRDNNNGRLSKEKVIQILIQEVGQ